MRLYSSFFALLNGLELQETEQYRELIENKLQEYKSEKYWEMFGYVYFGTFMLAGVKRADLIKKITDEQHYVKDIFTVAYFDSREEVDDNIDIVSEITDGSMTFVRDALAVKFSDDFLKSVQKTVVLYFEQAISKYDECQLMKLYRNVDMKGENYRIPLNKSGRMRMGIINPWPGDLSAESEVIIRIKRAAQEAGIECVMLSDWGHVLNAKDQKKTNTFFDAKQLDFVITTQYVTPKLLDSFYYHALWNPPEIPLNLVDYNQSVSNNYLMNDDYLTYDMGGMRNHLQMILMNKPRNIENTSMLTASFPQSCMLEPKLDNLKMFYCGMNWDKLVNNQNRHEGLFKLLDATGKVKFFGPDIMKNWGGIRPWEGYRCYQYPIPWDGFSILNEINECGVCLVISSDIHRRAGAVTNRAYEACAAGAVMISDNNEFMQKYFADAALFIYYNRNDPQDTFNQIMEKYRWIEEHKEEALAMVKRAQQIFREKFALDKQLLRIVSNHEKRFSTIAKDLFALNNEKKVLVTYVVNSLDQAVAKERLDIVIRNVKRQYYENVELVIGADNRLEDFLSNYIQMTYPNAKYELMELFDKKNSRRLTDGQVIYQILEKYPHDYFMNTSAREVWFYDHITTLVRSIEDERAYGAYSGRAFQNSSDFCPQIDYFNRYSDAELAAMSDARCVESPGEFLFTHAAEAYMPIFAFDLLDGLEHFAYACLLQIKYNLPLAFSKRLTLVDNGLVYDDRKTVMNFEMQVRMIRDMIRFELKEREHGGNNITFTLPDLRDSDILGVVKDSYLKIPLKCWAKYRGYLAFARIMGHNSKYGKKFMAKAEHMKKIFFENWG